MSDKQTIGWFNGVWGSPNELKIPINDRGLNFSDGIFETIYIENGRTFLLKEHLLRWKKSAHILGLNEPPSEETLQPIIKQALTKTVLKNGSGSIRLNWSRGKNLNRGIDIISQSNHSFWIEVSEVEPSFNPISTIISQYEKRNAESQLSQCKTLNYIQSVQARMEAKNAGFNDALLLSTTGEVCCGTTANIIVKRNNILLTPRIESGCLDGIMRAQGLRNGILKEAKLSNNPESEDEWLLINSLSCHSISKINQTSLKLYKNPERLWRSLLNK